MTTFDPNQQQDPSEQDVKMANVLATILHVSGGNIHAQNQDAGSLYASGQSQLAHLASGAPTTQTTTTIPAPTDTSMTTSSDPNADAVGVTNENVQQGYGGQGGHPGIDLGVPVGTPLVAAESGTITAAGNTDPHGYGNEVEITAADGTVMRYGHLSAIGVSLGQQVSAGTPIGKSGGIKDADGSGNSEGPHLHFEVRQNGQSVDPVPFLAGKGGVVAGSATGNAAAQTTTVSNPSPEASTAANILDVAAGQNPGHQSDETATTTTAGKQQQKGTGSTADNDPGAVDAFLAATKQHESGGNYQARYSGPASSDAAGAYQFLSTTWRGAGGSTASADQASPEEQDRVARNMAMSLFNEFHSWRLVAIAWYGGPGVAQQVAAGQNPGSPEGQGPYLEYGDTIQRMMQGGK